MLCDAASGKELASEVAALYTISSEALVVEYHGSSKQAVAAGKSLPAGTTIQLELLPSEQTYEDVMNSLDSHGFANCYDFIYLPTCLQTRLPLQGHVLVNFISRRFAHTALQQFSDRVSEYMHCTSLSELIERYRNSPVMHEAVPTECKPKLFKAGYPVAFPPPTLRLRAPRTRGKNGKPQKNQQVGSHADAAGVDAHQALADVWFVDFHSLQAGQIMPIGWGACLAPNNNLAGTAGYHANLYW